MKLKLTLIAVAILAAAILPFAQTINNNTGGGGGGTGLSGLTTNAVIAAASATTAATPCTGCTLDASGNYVTPGGYTAGNGSSTTGALTLKGKTSGSSVVTTVLDMTATGALTLPGVTGTIAAITGSISSGQCLHTSGTAGAITTTGSDCGAGGTTGPTGATGPTGSGGGSQGIVGSANFTVSGGAISATTYTGVISSVTRASMGHYTINFTGLSSGNYNVFWSASDNANVPHFVGTTATPQGTTSYSYTVQTASGSAFVDVGQNYIIITQ